MMRISDWRTARRLRRPAWDTVSGVLAAGMIAAAIAPAAHAAPVKVKLALPVKVLVAAPIFLAVDSGNLKKRDIDMDIVVFRGGPPAIAALLSGEVQFMSVAVDEFLKVAGKGKLLRVYNYSHSNTLNLQMGNAFLAERKFDPSLPVKDRVRQFKGATLGTVTLGGATDIYARWLFKYAGLDPQKDLKILRVGDLPAMVAAVNAKKIDGFLLSAPAGQIMEARGIGKIAILHSDVPPFRTHEYFGISVTPAYLAKNREVIRHVVAAVKEGQELAHRDPKAAAKILHGGSFKDLSLELLESSMMSMQANFRPGLMTDAEWAGTVALMRDAGFKEVENLTLKEGADWTNELAR